MCTSERSTFNFNVFAFVMLVIFLGGGISFLVLTFLSGNQYVNKRTYCVQAQGSWVWPGPGAPASTYCQGHITFQRSDNIISWAFIHNLSSPVLSISLYGPIYETNPLNGPLYLVLCQAGTSVACLAPSPNMLSQRIEQTSSGLPIDNYVDEIAEHSDRYIARIATATYPNGEVAMKFFSLC